MVAVEVVALGRVWLMWENTGRELLTEQFLIPRLPMILQEGMFPSPFTFVQEGGIGMTYARNHG